MKEFRFNLYISLDEFMAYYEGAARDVLAVSDDSLTVRIVELTTTSLIVRHSLPVRVARSGLGY